MRRRVYLMLSISVVTIFILGACNKGNEETKQLSMTIPSTNPTITISPVPTLQPYLIKVEQLMEDFDLPIEIHEQFKKAVSGDEKAQQWLSQKKDENKGWTFLSKIFPYHNSQEYFSENECYYNIGMLYYSGDDYLQIKQDKEKAFYWLNLSAEKGSFLGAIQAGDIAQSGDGIATNEKDAFNLYKSALEIENNDIAYERLGYCYKNGIGTDINEQLAQEFYFSSALAGNKEGLYQLLSTNELSLLQTILLSKATSSMDYYRDYFSMVYEGLNGYNAEQAKLQIIKQLTKVWDNETDPVATKLKESVCENQYFPKALVEELIKTSYTYSYHTFADKYGVKPNLSHEDGKLIQFKFTDGDSEFENYYASMAQDFLDYEECEFYELDFNKDGENEIGIPIHTGAGGAFSGDGFCIFTKNPEGLYEAYAFGPDCTLRDGMRLIQYDDRIYFITNPYSDTQDAPHDIGAYVIDEDGIGHTMNVNCSNYQPKEVKTQVYDSYSTGEFDDFISDIMIQAQEAISATKRQEMYNPIVVEPLTDKPQDDPCVSSYMDVYYAADLNNDNMEEFIRKGHLISQTKYYNDCNIFQIYDNEAKLVKNPEPILDILPYYDYYGLHSGGNLYDLLPIAGDIVQFWTQEKDNKTYCIALTRNELLYGLHVYTIQNDKPIPVFRSLLFDEVQDIDVVFEEE